MLFLLVCLSILKLVENAKEGPILEEFGYTKIII